MLTKIDNAIKYGKLRNGFGIQILYPGLIRPALNDSGFVTIGRIDHARILPGTFIPMHPHKDDEILTYLRSGQVRHLDSEGFTHVISSRKLMMMNAGSSFYHEERVLDEGGILQGLQIFLRPGAAGLHPHVQFHALPDVYSTNQWRKIAGAGEGYPLLVRSDTWVMDMRLEKGAAAFLPNAPAENTAMLLYVLSGTIQADAGLVLSTGESLLIESGHPPLRAPETADMVLFITRTGAPHFDGGMYSGNLH